MSKCLGFNKEGRPCGSPVKEGVKFCRLHKFQETQVPIEVYHRLASTTPEEKAEIVRQLMKQHPDGGLQLPERDGLKADLSNINLDLADPTHVQVECNAEGKTIGITNLEPANLAKANLRGVNLSGSHLMTANLQGADLSYANLSGSILEYCNLAKANLTRANLQGANLNGANLQMANLWEANLQHAHLDNAQFKMAQLRYTKLQHASLIGANFEHAHMWDVELENAILRSAKFHRASLHKANLQHANLMYSSFQKANLHDAKLQKADLSFADFQDAQLVGARLQETNSPNANFSRANLYSARLDTANLWNTNFKGANLNSANLYASDLRYAELSEVNLTGANIRQIYISGAHLDKTRLRYEQLGGQIGEEVEARKENLEVSDKIEKYEQAKHGYRDIKQNFDSLGDYNASSWAYRKERRMEKLEARQQMRLACSTRDWPKMISSGLKYLFDELVEIICDYGEGFSRVLGWIFVSIFVIGPATFWILGAFQWSESGKDIEFRPYYDLYPYIYTYRQLLLYTIDTFTTANFAEWQPASMVTRLLSGCFAMSGIFLVGLLGFVAGNRIRRS